MSSRLELVTESGSRIPVDIAALVQSIAATFEEWDKASGETADYPWYEMVVEDALVKGLGVRP